MKIHALIRIGSLCLFGYLGTVFAASPVESVANALPDGNSPLIVTFQSPTSRVWLGKPQVIAFQSKNSSPFRQHCSFQVDSTAIRVLDSPLILEGQTIGYMRVMGLKAGHSRITIESATMDVEIVPDDVANVIQQEGTEIVSPTQGSVVWGSFVVGVERFGNEHRAAPLLRLGNGHEIYGHSVPNEGPGPVSRFVYTVHPEDLQPGPNEMSVAQSGLSSGADAEPSTLVVDYLPQPPDMVMHDQFQNHVNELRPKEAGVALPKVVDDKDHGKVVAVDPGVCLAVNQPKDGTYQMFITTRGDLGGDALPTVSVMLDQRQDLAVAQTRLATTEWQRIPVGRPFKMPAGPHTLTVRLRNPFYGAQDDRRTLFLDSFELARLDSPKVPAPNAAPLASAGGPTMARVPTVPGVPAIAGVPTGSAPTMAGAPTMESAPMMTGAPTMTGAPVMESATMEGNKSAAMLSAVGSERTFGVMFRTALDGIVVNQRIRVVGMAFWPDHDHTPPPVVELMVNHSPVAKVTTGRPTFSITPDQFRAGQNVLELKATLSNGQTALSPPETVTVPASLAAPTAVPTRPFAIRFTAWDAAWKGSLAKMIDNPDGSASFYSNGSATLTLPDDLQGNFRIYAEARGVNFNGPPKLTLLQQDTGGTHPLADVGINQTYVGDILISKATFNPGSKSLVVQYNNDAYQQGKGDRNLYLRSIRLEPIPANPPPHVQPTVAVLYPKPSVRVGDTDAVVADIETQGTVSSADLIIDGAPQHLEISQPGVAGPLLLPLLTRGLSPGMHELAVVATIDGGETCKSPQLSFEVAAPGEAPDPTYARAVFLLNHMAYGPEPSQLAAVLTQGPKEWLKKALFARGTDPNEKSEMERLSLQFPRPFDAVPRATLYLMTEPNPVRARFVMWAENHFSTWVVKDGADQKGDEHDRFARLGPAPFSDLLFASATSPAMITYLDQRNSFAGRLNENYAREIMELHTLGVKGGYNQKDVTTLADLLTGWTLSDEASSDGGGRVERLFRYDPDVNSDKPCQILGMEFPGWEPEHRFDRVQTALEMLAAHPSCAQFISRKLLEHYVSDPAPPELINAVAKVYQEKGGDMREMLLSLVDQPSFWSAAPRVASPVDYSVRAARIAQSEDVGLVSGFMSSSGMGMFDRATPDGYPEANGFFCSSNALLQRWKFASNIQNTWLGNGALPRSILGTAPVANAPPSPSDTWTPEVSQRVIDLLSYRSTGFLLSQASNEAALHLLESSPDLTANGRCHLLASFIEQIPETSLR